MQSFNLILYYVFLIMTRPLSILTPIGSLGFETIFDLCQAGFSVLFRRHSGLCQEKGRGKMPTEIEKRTKSLNKRANDLGLN